MTNPRQILKSVFGYDKFRHNQEAVINDVLAAKDTVVLMPTGGGKSLCYQVPALCMEGLTIVVSPLISLMKDQVDALKLNGICAAFLNSSQHHADQQQVFDQIRSKHLKLLYVAPERLMGNAEGFINFLKTINVSLFAIDEAHCISQWGHDFRPEYLVLGQLKNHFPAIPIIALTATADKVTRGDIVSQLNLKNFTLYENSFNRPNIYYYVKSKSDYYNDLFEFLTQHRDDSGIIYCLSRASADRLANDLVNDGFKAAAYHAGLDKKLKDDRQEMFLKDDVRIIVATVAFGMGINKSNVRFVVHVDLPKNIEGYYQETGRAGRDGLHSEAVLFYGAGDVMKLKKFATIEDNPGQTRILQQKLQKMTGFCETRQCRRKYLLNYFGEEAPDDCGSCDVCLNKPTLHDATIEAQKVLSAVARLNERFGVGYVTDVLWGANSEKIRAEHKQLKVYGVGKDKSKDEWKYYIRELIQAGYLAQSDDEYPVLKLTEKSWPVLKQSEKVFLPKPAMLRTTKEPEVFQQHPYEKPLFDDLKQLRNQLAHEQNVPAYIILSDSSLLDLATYLPASLADLAMISGFGAFKIEKYGLPFLDLVMAYCATRQLESRIDLKQPKRQRKSAAPASSDTKRTSLNLFRQGKTTSDIAAERQLSTSTIESHLAEFVASGDLVLSDVVPAHKLEAIEKAARIFGTASLKTLKENLPEEITYGEIRMTLVRKE